MSARGVVKRYGTLEAVRGLDFTIARGTCVGLLGPNGAGKTTLMKMMTGVSPVTAGTLEVLGRDVMREAKAVKARLGVMPQETHLHRELSVRENLVAYARYFGVGLREARGRAELRLAQVGLAGAGDDAVTALSGGMKRRLLVARALLNDPELLVLDEPTTGLDPQARHALWGTVRALRSQGMTVVLSTHLMEEAAGLCDHVLIMDHGRLLAEGRPAALVADRLGEECVEVEAEEASRDALEALILGQGLRLQRGPEGRVFLFPGSADGAMAALSRLSTRHLLRRRATLEDVFLLLTGRGLT